MKKFLPFLVVLAMYPLACGADKPVASVTLNAQITSEAQEGKIESALASVPGVTKAKASYRRQTVVAQVDPAKANNATLIDALKKAGFPSTPIQANYLCPDCGAAYQGKGSCLLCGAELQPVGQEETKAKSKK